MEVIGCENRSLINFVDNTAPRLLKKCRIFRVKNMDKAVLLNRATTETNPKIATWLCNEKSEIPAKSVRSAKRPDGLLDCTPLIVSAPTAPISPTPIKSRKLRSACAIII